MGSKNKILSPTVFLIGILPLSIFYWLVETGVDTLIASDFKFRSHLLPLDSHELWMRLFVVGLISACGIIAYFMTNSLRRLQSEVSLLDRRYEDLVDTLPETVFEMDENAVLTFANNRAFEAFGFTREEFNKGINALDLIVPSQRKRAAENIGRIMAGEDLDDNEYTALRKDGTRFPIMVASSPILENGRPVGLRGILFDVTEKKEKEEFLKKFSRAMDQSPVSVVITDTRGTIEYVNRFFTEVTGYTFDEAVGQNPRIMKSGETPVETYRELWQTIAAGKDWRGTLLNKKKDGSLYWEDVRISPISADHGKVTHYVAIKEDITDRLVLLEKISSSERQLSAILNNMQDTYYRTISDGTLVMVSPSAEKLLGYTRDELIGMNLADLYADPGGRAAFLEALEAAGGELRDAEAELRHKDGSIVIVSTNARYYYDEEGSILGVEGTTRDVTKRKEIERALAESERRFRTLFENTPVSIWEEDFSEIKRYLDGMGLKTPEALEKAFDERPELLTECVSRLKVANVNKATLELHDVDSAEMLFNSLPGTFTGESLQTFRQEVLSLWRGERQMDVDSSFTTAGGKKKHVRIKLALSPGHEETLSDVLVSIIDTTERVRLLEGIRQTASELDLSNRMKELYIDILSHDILNPVNVIMNASDILRQGVNDASMQEFISMILEASTEIEELIDLAKKYSKVLGAEGLEKKEIDLNDSLAMSLGGFEHAFRKKNISFRHQQRPGSVVMANPLIDEVFDNLVSNAAKYGRAGGAVETGIEEEPGHFVAFVTNEGEGVPEAYKEKIFSRFERLEGRAVKGTGLGLAICKRIMELHGGRIWVEDNPAGGCIFKVRFEKKEA